MSPVDWGRVWRPDHSPLETMVRAAITYVFVIVAFRLVGRKELGRHSTYDIVLLFFVGVAMRQTIVGNDESLTTAMVGFSTLLAIDVLVTSLAKSSRRAADFIDGPVRELIRDGQLDEEAMRKAHVSREQILAAVRGHGREGLDDVRRAYLERSGRVSVVFGDGRGE